MPRVWIFRLLIAAALASHARSPVRADDPPPDDKPAPATEDLTSSWYLPMKTLGGRQFWGDVHYFHDWRIQHNIFLGHHRLLDGNDLRHCSGTLEECHQRLAEIRKARSLSPMSGKAVILIHGIVRSSKSFDAMEERLEAAGYQVFGFDYPSTRVSIPASAEYLRRCIDSLEGITEINLVVHSMGGLVVRAALTEERDPRLHRLVMLGVPNQGARMANLLQSNYLYRWIYGPAGQQLIVDPDGFIAQLPTPDFEFAIIAGARGTPNGYNPLIPGDDDGTVSVEASRLPGARDFMTVSVLHSLMMNEPSVIEATERFLRTGAFRESGEAEPIPHPEAEGAEVTSHSSAGNPATVTP